VVALKCRAHFIAEHICASQQNSLDPDCWDLCNLVGFGPRAAVSSQRAECACTALMRLAQSFAHPEDSAKDDSSEKEVKSPKHDPETESENNDGSKYGGHRSDMTNTEDTNNEE
jgi:hypothetical protein